MKKFFKNLLAQPGTKAIAGWGLVVGLVFSTGWSIQEGKLNLWPLLFVVGIWFLFVIVAWLMRKNE